MRSSTTFFRPISINALWMAGLLLLIGSGCATDPGAADTNTTAPEAVTETEDEGIIVFFGNSLTAGYGLEEDESFPALIQDRLDSLGYPYRVVNAGVSGETSSGGTGRIDWVLRQPMDVFILELGGNDGLRGIDPEQTKANLQEIIDAVEAEHPQAEIILAGMQIPPNMGPDYTERFREIFPELARENEEVILLPFLLEGVGGVPDLNQADGIHPNAQGARIVAETVWEVLQKVLERPPSG